MLLESDVTAPVQTPASKLQHYMACVNIYATTIFCSGLVVFLCGFCGCVFTRSPNHAFNVTGLVVFLTQFKAFS
jgi:hypothetical protein